jgi:cytidylate kinase
MIVGIFGASCAGKSSIASQLARQESLPLRSCGVLVHEAAKALGVGVGELPDRIHRDIDEQTVEWALRTKRCIVEGRFLDSVLADVPFPSFFVQLTATPEVRLVRACSRSGDAVNIDKLHLWDEADAAFRGRMYARRKQLAPNLCLDTSTNSVEECVVRLKSGIPWPHPGRA